jgi:hypothetical protein
MAKRALIGILAAWAILVPACPVAAAEPGVRETVTGLMFPEKPADGTKQWGATYYAGPDSKHTAPDAPQYHGWCILAEEGTTPFKQGSQAVRQRPVRCWYTVNLSAYFVPGGWEACTPEYVPGRPGVYKKGLEWLAQFPKDCNSASYTKRDVAIGDGAIVGESRIDSQCRATAGGLQVTVSVGTRIQIGDWERMSPKAEDITDLSKEYTNTAGIVRTYQKHHARSGDVAAQVAQQIVAGWQVYERRKVGPGPNFKGLYQDVRPHMVTPDKVPEGFVCTNYKAENFQQIRDNPSFEVSSYYVRSIDQGKSSFTSEHLDFTVRLMPLNSAKPFDQMQTDAHAEFEKLPLVSNVPGKASGKPIKLRGADEAKLCRSADPRSDYYVVARRYNAVIEVRGGHSKELDYTAMVTKMAQQILDGFVASDTGQQAKPTGLGNIQLAAEPATLWADGRSTSRIRLVVTGDSSPATPATFTMAAKGGGALRDEQLTTNAAGAAETLYTASTRPGTAIITAESAVGSAKVEIAEGGLVLTPEKPEQGNLLADGTSTIVLVVRGVGLGGKAMVGQTVNLAVDESRLPAHGVLQPQTVTLDRDGQAKITYQPPAIDPVSGFRMDNVYVTATTGASGGAPALRADYRVMIYAGELAYLVVEKPGFSSTTRFPVALPARNVTIRGKVTAEGYASQRYPLAYANLQLISAGQSKAQVTVKTDAAGEFTLRVIGDPTSSREAEVALPTPLLVELDTDISRVLADATVAMKALVARGVDILGPGTFLLTLPQKMAAADPAAKEPLNTPQGLRNVGMRLARYVLYVKLLYERQVEDLDWLMQSAGPVVDQLADMLSGIDQLEAVAKEKMGAEFDARVWKKMKGTVVGRFLRTMNVWQKQNTRLLRKWDKKAQQSAKDNEAFRDAVGLEKESDESLPAKARELLHWAANPTDAASEKAQETAGLKDAGDKIKGLIGDAVKAILRDYVDAMIKENATQSLAQAGRMAEQGEVSALDFADAAERAKTLFADYQSRHDQLNLANLDREFYRLDTRLFMDTVVKGVFIYANVKGSVSGGLSALKSLDLAKFKEIQKSVTESGDAVNTAAGYLDAAFRVYQAKFWLEDCGAASQTLDDIDHSLLR